MALGWRNQYTRYKDFFLNVYGAYRKKTEAKMFVEILLSISVSAFFVFLALRPTIVTILGLIKTIQEKEKTVEIMEQKLENLATARIVYDQSAASIPLLESAIPTVPAPEILSRQIQGLAIQNALDVTGFAVEDLPLLGGEVKTNKDLTPLPPGSNPITFNINIRSSSFQPISFLLAQLERLRVPIKIDSFTISQTNLEDVTNLILAVGGRSPYLSKEGESE